MNKFPRVKQLTVGMALFSTLASVNAATQPTFTLAPTTPTTVKISANGNAVVQYRVTNQTKVARTLTMVPIPGVRQLKGNEGECANPFMLASKQSCLLTLKLNESQLPGQVTQGPVVCKTRSPYDNRPDPFLCSQPSQIESLSITRLGAEQAALSVTPSTRTLIACGASSDFTVTNNSSTITATNILANLTGTALVGNVSQNFSNCARVLPSQSCTLIFTPQCIGAVTLASFPIQGDNTLQVGASIDVVLPGDAPIAVTAGSPLALQGSTGTPVTGTLTVKNNSPILTATNIAADLTGALATAGVTQDASNCATVLHGASCTLTFTPGSQAVSTTSVIVKGSNTSQTTATIAVNAPPEAPIQITAGSPLTLQTSGSTGTMTIKNNSSTERALNIASNFTGTSLSGKVSQTASTCASVNPGASCTLTFTPGATAVAQTNFPIQGNNTTAATGAILIGTPLSFAYVVTGGNGTVSKCPVNSNGTFGACTDSGRTGVPFSNPRAIALNSTKTRAYVTNQGNNSVTLCPIQSNGTFGVCTDSGNTGVAFNNPRGIVLNSTGTTAYVTNLNGDFVSLCPVNSDGTFGACSAAASGLSNTTGILLNSTSTIAYVGQGSLVLICPINSNGTFGTCSDSGQTFNAPTGIVLNSAGAQAYVTNQNTTTVSLCPVNSNGTFGTCTGSGNTGTAFNGPSGIVLNSAGTQAYVTNLFGDSVSLCPVNADGTFGACADSGNSGVGLYAAWGIAR